MLGWQKQHFKISCDANPNSTFPQGTSIPNTKHDRPISSSLTSEQNARCKAAARVACPCRLITCDL